MIDWSSSMEQTFEYYIVDPNTWKDSTQLRTVKSCTITRDLDADTLGSATIDIDESIGECYIRVYLIAIQNGYREKIALGTFLVQTPSSGFDGRTRTYSMDAYTPLIELKEKHPPIGYTVPEDSNIMELANIHTRNNVRAPVVNAKCDKKLFYDFVANNDDTWLTFLNDYMLKADYRFDLDGMGRILFAPIQQAATMQPVWTYSDDNSSILLPEVTIDRDLFGIPNVIEIVYSKPGSNTDSGKVYYIRLSNDDPNSPTSTVSRGREIMYRETDPDLIGTPTEEQIMEYAKQRLRQLSSLECTVSYSHGYCPVRVGDCIRLDYTRSNIPRVTGKVISQTIKCDLGCQVTEKATFTTKLWR